MATYAKSVESASQQVKHETALALYREWKTKHEDQRVFVLQAEVLEYQRGLSQFIEKAEAGLTVIKSGTFSSIRYSDSIGAVETLIKHARDKRAFFDDRFVSMSRDSGTFARKMTFDEQRMVPQLHDLGDVAAKMREMETKSSATVTPSQAWALLSADLKGELNEHANCELAIKRLQQLNQNWKTTYGRLDLAATFRYMVEQTKIATQYRLDQVPTNNESREQVDKRLARGEEPLYKLLMQSGFRQTWETGISQASPDRGKRGAVEEQMGYSAALRRTSGKPQDYVGGGSFEPDKPSEMPRYAATIDPAQKAGVAERYGSSYIVWKASVRDRATWTPGDSWNMGAEGPQSVKNYISMNHPEVIFAHAEEPFLRLFMAQATGKDQTWLQQNKEMLKTGGYGDAYIETQIHGDLTWNDVAEVVLDPTMRNLEQVKTDFEGFKTRNAAYNFAVSVRPAKAARA